MSSVRPNLPPHRRSDGAIELTEGVPLPMGRTFYLSIPEEEVMDAYIAKSLKQGYRIYSNWVEIDEENVRAIREWPYSKMVKELQQFLGFSNFY